MFSACGGETDLLAEARALQQRGALEESLDPLRRHLAAEPDDAEAHFLHGAALSMLARPSEAQFSLREAMNDSDWLIPAAATLAQNALSTRNYHSALQAAQAILDQDADNVEGLRLRATAHIESRKGYAEALEDADRILEIDPEHLDAGTLRAIALLGLYRVDEAEEQLLKSAELERGTSGELQATYCVGMLLFFQEREDFEAADRQALRCNEDHPTSLAVLSAAVEYFESRGRAEDGLALLEEALEKRPENLDVRLAIVARLSAAGRHDAAEALLVEAADPGDGLASIPARFELVRYYRSVGRLEEAADLFSSTLEESELSVGPKVRLSLVELLVGLDRFDEAERAADRIEDKAHRVFGKGYIAVFRGDYALALAQYSDGYATWPDNAVARYYGAYAAEQLGLFDRAIDEYRYSIRIDSNATDARYRLARILLYEGLPKVALESIDVDSANNPLDREEALLSIEAAMALGRVDVATKRLKGLAGDPRGTAEAIAAIANGVAGAGAPADGATWIEESGVDLSDPRAAEALRTYVILKGESGDAETAASAVQRALERASQESALHEVRGLLLERFSQEPSMAIEAYRRAAELDPGNAFAHTGMARAYLAGQDMDGALAAYRRAHDADPSRAGIAIAYAGLLSRHGGSDSEGDVREILERSLKENPTDWRVAMRLAELLESEDPASDRVLELAERARRFRGGAPALDLLARVRAARGETAGAEEARARADEIRAASAQRDSVE